MLVDLEQAQDREKQQEITNRIKIEFKNGMFKDIPEQGLEILRHWYLPALRELVVLRDFNPDPCWISQKIGITPEEPRKDCLCWSIRGFSGSKMALPSQRTEYSYPEKIYPILIAHYHLQMLERSFHGHRLPREKRHFEALTIAIDQQDLANSLNLPNVTFARLICWQNPRSIKMPSIRSIFNCLSTSELQSPAIMQVAYA